MSAAPLRSASARHAPMRRGHQLLLLQGGVEFFPALVEAMDAPPAVTARDEPQLEQILPGVTIAASSASGMWIWISVVGVVLVALIAGIAVLTWMLLRKKGQAGATGKEAEAAR